MIRLRVRKDSIRACLEKARQDRSRLLDRAAHICHDFSLFCANHGICPPSDQPTRIVSYSRKARTLVLGTWAGAILATCVFATLNYVSLEGPPVVIISGSLLFALLIGMVAQCTVAQIAEVNILETGSIGRAKWLLIVGGLSAISSLAVFCFLRFAANPYTGVVLPFISMVFELGTMCFVAAAFELKPVYGWTEKFQKAFRETQGEIQILDTKIIACLRQLESEDSSNDDSQDVSTDSHARPDADQPAAKPRKPNGSARDHADLL